MVTCKGCGLETVDPSEPARYDIMNPDADMDNPQNMGPYDEACFAETYTGKLLAGGGGG